MVLRDGFIFVFVSEVLTELEKIKETDYVRRDEIEIDWDLSNCRHIQCTYTVVVKRNFQV